MFFYPGFPAECYSAPMNIPGGSVEDPVVLTQSDPQVIYDIYDALAEEYPGYVTTFMVTFHNVEVTGFVGVNQHSCVHRKFYHIAYLSFCIYYSTSLSICQFVNRFFKKNKKKFRLSPKLYHLGRTP